MTKNEFAFAFLCLLVITVITAEATAGPHGSSGWSIILANAGFLFPQLFRRKKPGGKWKECRMAFNSLPFSVSNRLWSRCDFYGE